MNSDRIKEIQSGTAYPNSNSVRSALMQVWNECGQEALSVKAHLIEVTTNIVMDNPGEIVSAFLDNEIAAVQAGVIAFIHSNPADKKYLVVYADPNGYNDTPTSWGEEALSMFCENIVSFNVLKEVSLEVQTA